MDPHDRFCIWSNEELENDEPAPIDGASSGSEHGSTLKTEYHAQEFISENILSGSDSEADHTVPPHPADTADDKAPYYTGKDGTIWKKTVPTTRYHSEYVLNCSQIGVKGDARNATTPSECFMLLFDQEILKIIVESTNIYIRKNGEHFQRERDAKETDEIEVKCLLGILILAGTLKPGRQNILELWDMKSGIGVEAIYLAMSKTRFLFLMRCLHFDDINSLVVKKMTDRLAPVRKFLDLFVQNCQKHYEPNVHMAIDEQLVRFRGRCPFRQYSCNKPAKYGIKFFALVEAKTAYTMNLEVYPGMQPDGPYNKSNKAVDVVKRMVEPVKGTNRVITLGERFTSVELANELLKSYQLKSVGVISKTAKEIPPSFKRAGNRQIFSSVFGFTDECTLMSYVEHKRKSILIMSSLHQDAAIDTESGNKMKPMILTYYNQTGGVDILDQMCSAYDVSTNSRRWPMTIFSNIMNIAGINALNIYTSNKEKPRRCTFLQTLGLELMKTHIIRRTLEPSMPVRLKRRVKEFLGIENESSEVTEPPAKRTKVGRCQMCGRARNKSTRNWCSICSQWICAGHMKTICLDCCNNE